LIRSFRSLTEKRMKY